MSVENGSDELWVGVKCQSNLEIAGSPRNRFRASLGQMARGGRALDGLGAFTALLNPTKLRMPRAVTPGVRRWGISFIVKRRRVQIAG